MKIKLLYLLVLVSLVSNSCRKHEIERKPRSFVKYYDTGITDDIVCLSFIDKNNGLAITNWDIVLKTIDGGKTWTKKTLASDYKLTKIQYFDSNIAYLMDDISLYKSTDAGETWIKITREEPDPTSKTFHFVSNLVGYQIYNGFGISKTVDGGLNWKSIIYNEANPLTDQYTFYEDVSCPTESLIFCNIIRRGGNNFIIKSEDGGITWQELPNNNLSESRFNNHFYSKNDGFIMSYVYKKLYKTTDGGLSWQYVDSLNLRNIKMVNEKIGLATSYNQQIGTLSLTNDGGYTWIPSIEETYYGYNDEQKTDPMYIDYQAFSDRSVYLACENGKFGVINFYNLGE